MDCDDSVEKQPEEPGQKHVFPNDVETQPAENVPADPPAKCNVDTPSQFSDLPETQIVCPAFDEPVTLIVTVRDKLVATLFCATKPLAVEYRQLIDAYKDELTALNKPVQDDFAMLYADARALNSAMVETEKAAVTPHEVNRSEYEELLCNLYDELDALTKAVNSQLESLDIEGPAYITAAPERQTQMMNTRRGVEIIHRMLSRTLARRKETSFAPVVFEEILSEVVPPENVEAIESAVSALYKTWHETRDKNFDALRDEKQNAEKAKDACINLIRSVLGAIDGIDSGLEYSGEADALPSSEFSDAWTEVYPRLSQIADDFFGKTGVTAHVAERGTPFDPDTMEPQSAVEAPDLKDEDVAAMVRRGFSLRGTAIRPVLVNVVRNS